MFNIFTNKYLAWLEQHSLNRSTERDIFWIGLQWGGGGGGGAVNIDGMRQQRSNKVETNPGEEHSSQFRQALTGRLQLWEALGRTGGVKGE